MYYKLVLNYYIYISLLLFNFFIVYRKALYYLNLFMSKSETNFIKQYIFF